MVRVHDAADLSLPLNEISLPLAVASLSSSSDGKYALATALDGTAAFVDVGNAAEAGRVETARSAVDGAGECCERSERAMG